MDPYAVLGVPRDAPARTIKRAFYRLALQHHPDKLPQSTDAAARAAAEEHFKTLAAAWEILRDPDARAAFDSGLQGHCSSGGMRRSAREVFAEFFGGSGGGAEEATGTAAGTPPVVVVVEQCSPEDVFNLPLFEGYLVIDPRQGECRRSVRTALPAAPSFAASDAGGPAGGWLAWATAMADCFSHERKGTVVVLGGEPGAEALAASLGAYLQEAEDAGAPTAPPAPAPAPAPPAASWTAADTAREVLGSLRRYCRRILVCRGGTDAVLAAFPVLGSDWEGLDYPTAAHIAPGVLLGSRAVPWDLRHLMTGQGVTHAVVAASAAADVAAAVPDIRLIVVDADDGDDTNMAPVWLHACAQIEAVVATGGRVMVSLFGRSRSASIVLAWLARAHGISAAMAAQLLRRKCPMVDWSLVFPEQLVAWLGETAPQIAM